MPRCPECDHYYTERDRPQGCPHCYPERYPDAYCVQCQMFYHVPEYNATTGVALRPACAVCLRPGPMRASGAELRRRKGLKPTFGMLRAPMTVEVKPAVAIRPVDPNAIELIRVEVTRTVGSIKLYLKSKIIEGLVRDLAIIAAKGVPFKPNVGLPGSPFDGKLGYTVRVPELHLAEGAGTIRFDGWNRQMEIPGYTHMDFGVLLAMGLADGVTFDFNSVCGSDGLNQIVKYTELVAAEMYAQYVLPVSRSATVIIKEDAVG